MISGFFIDRPKFALVISIVITLAGIIALNVIPIAEFPQITPPKVQVTTSYPGANAPVLRDSVASVIEEEVNGVDDMLYMSSSSSNTGQYELTVTFAVGTDPDIAAVNVQNRVSAANSSLPSEVINEGVIVRKQSSDLAMVVALVSPEGSRDQLFLSNYASLNIQDTLARVNGVGNVSQFGARDYGMRVWLDLEAMTALDITTGEIADAIRGQNILATSGSVGDPPYDAEPQLQFTLIAQGRLETVDEFEAIIVRSETDGSFVRLGDVARVELGAEQYAQIARLDNDEAAMMGIYLSPGSNAIAVADAIYEELDRLTPRFPPDVEYQVFYDSTEAVRASIAEVVETLVITFILVVAVTFVFLADWRATLIPTVAIPVSLVGTFAVLLAAGFSLNMVTLFAIILAIGVVVDDSIVVVENVKRLLQEGATDAREAARQSMIEVTGPVVATTLVLLAVFVPVAFMPGITGQLYNQFSVTLCVAVVISSINALTLSPALCAILLRAETREPRGPLGWFSRRIDGVRNVYGAIVGRLLRVALLGLVLFGGFVAATGWLFSTAPAGFLPIEDRGVFFGNVQLPDGASLARTEELGQELTDRILEVDGVNRVLTVAGFSILSGQAPNSMLVIVHLDDWDERTSPDLLWFRILQQVNGILASDPRATAFAFPLPPITGLGNSAGVEAEIQDTGGGTPQELGQAVRSLVFEANSRPELTSVFSTYSADVPQFFLDIDREKAEALGVPLSQVFSTLQAALGGSFVNDFNLFGKVYRVKIQAEPEYRAKIEDLDRVYIKNETGEMVPIRSLVRVEPTLGPTSIRRYNLFQSATVQAQNAAGYSTGDAIEAMTEVAERALPEGYVLTWTGTAVQQLEAGNLVIFIFVLAITFAYLFLVAQYESWSIPFAVVLSVVIAAMGAMIPIVVLPFLSFDLYAQIGIVLLIGLASKNAILIVEFAMQRRAEGLTAYDAAVEAARLRFRAVMMTALAFILGVAPLIIAQGAGAASRMSVGWVVFSGMLFATLIGIFFIPLLYFVIQWVRERVKGETASGAKSATAAPAE
ncbi:MAG: efflux RND transporter permease subunit [Paracoccaceae bacterium]